MNKREVGSKHEDMACKYLEEKGYKIVARNFRSYNGEIDIIALEEDVLVFVEVKYRANKTYGYAVEAVGAKKRQVIYRVAENFLSVHKQFIENSCRFDVIGFDNDKITHIKNAFGGM